MCFNSPEAIDLAGFLLGATGAALADNIENSGKQCGGGFEISEVKSEVGIRELESMRLSGVSSPQTSSVRGRQPGSLR